jgi:hypothetical protein
MQLGSPPRRSPLRTRLNAAACMLVAAGMPASASADSSPRWQFEGSALYYGERGRARVVEPIARITRLFPGGQTLSARLGLDAISGASPSGALPSGRVQTTTTPSGRIRTVPADQIPVSSFKDIRGSLDLEWLRPIAGRLTSTSGLHYSREQDYQSVGGSAALSLECMQRLTTFTVGAGFNRDTVTPRGGTRLGLADGKTFLNHGSDDKRVSSGMVGASRVLNRRWMVSVDLSRTLERGYLTEPYKVVSLMDPRTGKTAGELTENRPAARDRSAVLTSTVYHLPEDIVYASYRYYWDTWSVRSHTVDLKYRHPFVNETYLQPHLRYYAQAPADFFRLGLVKGDALPEFVSSDSRLGPMRSVTLGATYGFRIPGRPGDWSVRTEYTRQFGDGHPRGVVGVQRGFALQPRQDIGTVTIGYTVRFR